MKVLLLLGMRLFRVSLLVAGVCAALALLISGSAAGGSAVSNSTSGAGATHRHSAQLGAKRLLGRLSLPAGAIRAVREPAGGGSALARPGSTPATPALVDLHRWWRVRGSMGPLVSFLRAHPPHGTRQFMEGSSGVHGRLTSSTIGFSWPALPGVLSTRWLVVVVAPLRHGYTGVRADAEVVWIVPKPAAERVPPGARVLDVTRGFAGKPPSLSLTVTNPAKVQEIAAMLDRLPTVQPGVVACPAILVAPTVTFAFRASAADVVLAKASTLANGPAGACSPIAFSLRGRQQTPLNAQPAWLQRAGRVLGVTLSTG